MKCSYPLTRIEVTFRSNISKRIEGEYAKFDVFRYQGRFSERLKITRTVKKHLNATRVTLTNKEASYGIRWTI